MALPIFFSTTEDVIDPTNSNLPIVKPASTNRGSFGGAIFQHHLLTDNAGGTVVVSNHTGENNNKTYNSSSAIIPHMALVYNGHGGLVTPDYGQAVLNTSDPFNFAGVAITVTEATPNVWIEQFVNTAPSPRLQTSMAFDLDSSRSTLFGGTNNVGGGQVLADTWEWGGSQWIQKFPSNSPGGRYGHSMVYDYNGHRIVLYGGQNANGDVFLETWEWDTTTWTLHAVSDPGGLISCGLAFGLLQPGTGSQRYATVLFGGQTNTTTLDTGGPALSAIATSIVVVSTTVFPTNGLLVLESEQITYTGLSGGNTFTGCTRGVNGTTATTHANGTPVLAILNNTWEWNGTSWTQKNTAHSPPARAAHAMAFDSTRNKVVIFGGEFNGVLYADTWEYDGVDWKQIVSGINPEARLLPSMVYNQLEKTMVMFGGFDKSAGLVLGDTWNYDGINWKQLNILGPSARAGFAIDYDSVQNKIVLFGGTDQTLNVAKGDTWQFNNSTAPVLVQTSGDGYVYYDATGIFPIQIGNVTRTLGNFVTVITTFQHLFNSVATTLSSTIDNIVTTIPVILASNFPSNGIIFIESEQILYSGITTVSFTGCTRGYNGTTAVSHLSGTPVYIANQFTLNPLVAPDDPNFTSGTKTGYVLDGYRIAYFETGTNTSNVKPLILKTLSARSAPLLGDYLGPSSINGTVTSTSDGYSPVFGYAIESPFIDPLTSNLFQIQIEGSETVGLIKLRMAPFFGFIPPLSSVINSITPTSGIVGSTVIINGAGFLGVTEVIFNGSPSQTAPYTAISNNQLSVFVPAYAQTGTISVVTSLGTTTSVQTFHVIPNISNVSASSHAIGNAVTITGNTFTPVTAIDFNGINQASFSIVNDITITTTIPTGATSGPVHVSSPDGIATFASFSVLASPVISPSGIAPLNGAPDAYMSITGSGLAVSGAGAQGFGVVDFIPVSTTLNGSINNSVTTITVFTTAGFPSDGIIFIDSEQISYTSTSPTTFTGCTRGINGTSAASHLNGATVITTPNGSILNIARTIVNDTQISALVPTPSGAQPSAAYFVKITTDGGNTISTQSFSIIPKPTFLASNSFNPTSGAPGAIIDIYGQYGFTGVSDGYVWFDGYSSSTVTFINDRHIQAVVPTANITTPVAITVNGTGGIKSTTDGDAAGTSGTTSPSTFTILQQPSISSFSPLSGKTGDTITINGNNLSTVDRVFFFNVANAVSNTGNVNRSTTTIAAGSDGYVIPATPYTISVVNTITTPPFPSTGVIFIKLTDNSIQKINYAGKTGTTFTGCTGGTGTLHLNDPVYVVNVTTASPHNFVDGDLVLTDIAGNAGTPTDANFPGAYVNITKIDNSNFCYPEPVTAKQSINSSSASNLSFADAQALGTGLSIINNQKLTIVVPAASSGIGTAGAGQITASSGIIQPLSGHSSQSFTYLHAPTISSTNVNSGGWGSGGGSATQVVINGTNLLNSNSTVPTVLFGGTAATVLPGFTSSQLSVNVPSGANDGISLTTDGGTATSTFTIVKPPIVSSSTPTSTCAQNSINIYINGTNFKQTTQGQIGDPKVAFYHQTYNPVTPSSSGNTQIIVNSNQLLNYFNTYSVNSSDVTFTIYVYVYYNGGAISNSAAYYVVTSPQTFTDLYCIS